MQITYAVGGLKKRPSFLRDSITKTTGYWFTIAVANGIGTNPTIVKCCCENKDKFEQIQRYSFPTCIVEIKGEIRHKVILGSNREKIIDNYILVSDINFITRKIVGDEGFNIDEYLKIYGLDEYFKKSNLKKVKEA